MSTPPVQRLPERPDLAQLRRQAKDLRKAYLAGDAEAKALVAAHDRDPDPGDLPLHRAQLVVARSYGFDSWPKLKAWVDGINIARLIEVVRAGDVDAVRSLLETRPELVNTDSAENDEHRPIHYAVLGRLPDMVRLLMAHGADARQGIYPHREATSALTLASERGYDEIVAIIVEEEGQRKKEKEERERRASEQHASRQHASRQHASRQQASQQHASQHAREQGRAKQEPAPGGALLFGNQPMPLTAAVKSDDLAALAALLEAGADPDEPTRLANLEEPVFSSGSPLWHCAIAGRYEAARMLLERGADPNAMVYASGTPVFQAYGQCDERMIELLESHGGRADAATLGHYRRTEQAGAMLADAEAGKLPEEFSTMGALVQELLWSAACGGDPEIVKMALARTDWPRDDRRWYRMLEQPLRLWNHMGTFWENRDLDRNTYVQCFELLLERADPNVEGRFGMRILHDVAAARAHVSDDVQVAFATRLLDAGATLDRRDDLLKSTPLGWACRWGRAKLVALLLERGADPVETDAEPWATPRAWAEKRGHQAFVALLSAVGDAAPEDLAEHHDGYLYDPRE